MSKDFAKTGKESGKQVDNEVVHIDSNKDDDMDEGEYINGVPRVQHFVATKDKEVRRFGDGMSEPQLLSRQIGALSTAPNMDE